MNELLIDGNPGTRDFWLTSDVCAELKRLIPSDLYTFYLVKDCECSNLESLVQMMIIGDFLKLNGNDNICRGKTPWGQHRAEQSEILVSDGNAAGGGEIFEKKVTEEDLSEGSRGGVGGIPEEECNLDDHKVIVKTLGYYKQQQITFLDRKYTSAFVYFEHREKPAWMVEKERLDARHTMLEGEAGQSEFGQKLKTENSRPEPTKSFFGNVLIMLTDIGIEGQNVGLNDSKFKSMRPSMSNLQINPLAGQSGNRREQRKQEDFTQKMKKYNNLIVSPETIDFDSIKYLFDRLDMDGDGRVSIEDIQGFIRMQNIEISTEDSELMIQRANFRKKQALLYKTNMS